MEKYSNGEHSGADEPALNINSPLLNKIWEGVFSKIGMGAIFLAIAYLVFIKWEDAQKLHEDQWRKINESSERRFEMMWEKSQTEQQHNIDAILKCCIDKNQIYNGRKE